MWSAWRPGRRRDKRRLRRRDSSWTILSSQVCPPPGAKRRKGEVPVAALAMRRAEVVIKLLVEKIDGLGQHLLGGVHHRQIRFVRALGVAHVHHFNQAVHV